jgi:hypothetical protein
LDFCCFRVDFGHHAICVCLARVVPGARPFCSIAFLAPLSNSLSGVGAISQPQATQSWLSKS